MKTINRLIFTSILIYIVIILAINLIFYQNGFIHYDKLYMVYVNRVENDIHKYESCYHTCPDNLAGLKAFSGSDYKMVTGIYPADPGNDLTGLKDLLNTNSRDFTVIATEHFIYKVTYTREDIFTNHLLLFINSIVSVLFILCLILLFYLRHHIIVPFHRLNEVPYELSKGNLTIPLEENKNKALGKFIWGMELLRETLEKNKERELELQKEKKVLLLSISHDIKTPLSAIKLYSKALTKDLYKSPEKKKEVAQNIELKADEIEGYISEIIKASNEDFISFEVQNRDFYIQDVFNRIYAYYSDKMEMNLIDFKIFPYNNLLLHGDIERVIEVIQNVTENAIKYGDGKRIWIETSQSSEEYIIKINNTGCTLSQNELPHLFDSFFRGSNTNKQPGSGLGLYICRCLMHLMDGEITADVVNTTAGIMQVNIILRVS